MELDVIIKIIVYMIIVRIIMSKVNKKKNMRSNNRKNSTPRASDRQRGTGLQKKQGDRKNNRNLDLNSFRDIMPKSNSSLSPEERMKQREKELENMNKR